jgi:hypothetical protein
VSAEEIAEASEHAVRMVPVGSILLGFGLGAPLRPPEARSHDLAYAFRLPTVQPEVLLLLEGVDLEVVRANS